MAGWGDDVEKYFKKLLENSGNGATIKLSDINIGKSVGANAKNYDVIDPNTGAYFHFVEGTKIQNSEVFAGYGVKAVARESHRRTHKRIRWSPAKVATRKRNKRD